ncbi:MAG: DNA topology modulation protein FlaR [Bacillus sp. (in: firmicutes)]
MKETPNKIHIIGSVGSGKTTLAKLLSIKLNIPYYELDNIVWKRHPAGDTRRTEEEREQCLYPILQNEKWIIEGAHYQEWITSSLHQAECIIFLDPNYAVRTYRIIKRFIWQKIGWEKSHYKPTVPIFLKMFVWNRNFEEAGKPMLFDTYGKLYENKLVVIKNKREMKKLLQ